MVRSTERGLKIVTMLLNEPQTVATAEEAEQTSDQESVTSSVSSVSLDVVKPKQGKVKPRTKRSLSVRRTGEKEEEEDEGPVVRTRKRRKRTRGGGVKLEVGAEEDVCVSKRQRVSMEDATPGGPETETARGKIKLGPFCPHSFVCCSTVCSDTHECVYNMCAIH